MRSALARATLVGALLLAPAAVLAQESDVARYAVDVRLEPASRAATVKTTIAVSNVTDAPKRQLQLRLTDRARVLSISLGGQPAVFEAEADKRFPGLQVVRVTLPAPIAGRGPADLTVDARLSLEKPLPDAVIAPGRTALLPTSYWFPVINTAFTQYGINTAPTRVTVTAPAGERAVAGGTLEGPTFNQPLFDLPVVVSGAFAAPEARTVGGLTIQVWAPATGETRAGAERLLGEAEKIASYYASALGPAPKTTFHIIASEAAAGYVAPSGIAFAPRVFLRTSTDAESFELLAEGLARAWIAQAAVRGAQPGPAANRASGVAVVQDALPRYLALAALGNRFGSAAERLAFDRARVALLRMGTTGSAMHLSAATPALPAFRGIVTTRGPLALRILEREAGRDAMFSGIREAISAGRTAGWITAGSLRGAIEKAAGRDLRAVFATWFESIVEPDLQIGVPVQSGGAWVSRLRNRGDGSVTVDVVATTASGKRLTSRATVPPDSEVTGELPSVRFDSAEPIASVEIDPEQVIIQTDYSNDAQPARRARGDVIAEGLSLVLRKDFAAAETRLRPLVTAEPADAAAHAWLARALIGQGKTAEAVVEANAALAAEPAPVSALAWSHIVLAQAAAGAGRHADAASLFRLAFAEAIDTPAVIAAREGLAASDRALGRPLVADESIRGYFTDLDRALSSGVNTAQAAQFIDPAELPDLVKGLVTAIPRRWATEVVRAEPAGPDELLVDVRFTVTPTGGEPDTAPALVRLRRGGDGWKMVGLQLLGG